VARGGVWSLRSKALVFEATCVAPNILRDFSVDSGTHR
jgi:hypothetical protein